MPMETIAGFETWSVEFGRDGQILYEAGQVQPLLQALQSGVTDVLTISHGWNNDMAEARELYGKLLASMHGLPARLPAGRRLAVMLVYWPSKRFADSDLIAGGAADVGDAAPTVEQELRKTLDRLKSAFSGEAADDPEVVATLDKLDSLVPRLEEDDVAQEDFVRLLRSLFPVGANDEEEVLQDSFYTVPGEELLRKMARPFRPAAAAEGGATGVADFGARAADGGAQGLGNAFRGIKNGALNLLNLFTYYEMKERAGQVGTKGVADVLARAQREVPGLRVHLCGHSFGGRVVAAAAAAHRADDPASAIRSIALLQAAFSHWGFAKNYDGHTNGFFRSVFEGSRLAGPVVITHTKNDTAVGMAYPIASRLRNQVASGLGDENDPYGGIGRNGAQKTPEVETTEKSLRDIATSYGSLAAGRIYNLEGNGFIGNHGDIHGVQVAHAIWAAMLATS
jgi:hypothetical protein